MATPRHFLDLSDFSGDMLTSIITHARAMKDARKGKPKGMAEPDRPLDGHLLAMIFERPSTRTRVSFDVMNSSSAGLPACVCSIPRLIAALMSSGCVTRSP